MCMYMCTTCCITLLHVCVCVRVGIHDSKFEKKDLIEAHYNVLKILFC